MGVLQFRRTWTSWRTGQTENLWSSAEEYVVLPLESNDYRQWYSLGNEHLESSPLEEDLETSSLETCTNWPCLSSKVEQRISRCPYQPKWFCMRTKTHYTYYWSATFKRQRSNRKWKGHFGDFIFINILNFPFGTMEALKMTFFPPTHFWNLLPGLTCTFSVHGFLATAGGAILCPHVSINFSLTGDFL